MMRDDVEDHVTGSARSEGYYKIDMRDKVKYLPHHRDRPKDASQPKQKVRIVTCLLADHTMHIIHIQLLYMQSFGEIFEENLELIFKLQIHIHTHNVAKQK